MFYYSPHRTQTINGYLAEQAEDQHRSEEEENQAAWNEYWSEKNAKLKDKSQKEESEREK